MITLNEPFEIMQRDKAVYFVSQNRVPWKAFFDEQLPTDPDPFYMGYSVARRQGATLVVDSSGFRDLTMLDDKGIPHTEQMRLTTRFHLGKGGRTLDGQLHHHRPRRLHPPLDRDRDLHQEAGEFPDAGRGVRGEAGVDGAAALRRRIVE